LYEDSEALENVIDDTRPIFAQTAGQFENAIIAGRNNRRVPRTAGEVPRTVF
jgi:hypothetical protein